MITVAAPAWLSSEGQGRCHFLTLPPEKAVEIRVHSLGSERRGFGSVRVSATINGVGWRTSLFPQKSRGYILPIKAEVRRSAGIQAGDDVTVTLELLYG